MQPVPKDGPGVVTPGRGLAELHPQARCIPVTSRQGAFKAIPRLRGAIPPHAIPARASGGFRIGPLPFEPGAG